MKSLGKVEINVSGELREVEIIITDSNTIRLVGIGSVVYEMLDDELILMKVFN